MEGKMFIDREIELKQIENHFRSNKAELLIIYGRRSEDENHYTKL
jgi:AAA+ ATPase superfamily predicted ATPase